MGCGASTPTKEVPSRPANKPQANGSAGPVAARKLTPESPDPGLNDTHEVIRFLGRGGTGDTHLYKEKATGELVAIKLVKRPIPKVLQPNLLREIKIQADLGEGHINIIQAKEALLTDNHLALVLEFAAGGSLTSFVTDKWQDAQKQGGLFCLEDEARYFFRQFISAVDYCHKHLVAHRDLKLDNTLLSDDMPPLIKLCDFGFAREWQADALMHTHIGTPVYMAPELIHSTKGGYDGKQVDVWASGILLVVMLIGQFPYDHVQNPDPNSTEAHHEVWEQQTAQDWEQIPHLQSVMSSLSAEVKDLLTRIFKTDEAHRITIPEIKEHPWYTKPLDPKYQKAQSQIDALQGDLDKYTAHRRIHGALLKKRSEDLQRMLDQAAVRPVKGGARTGTPRMRIDLRESQILDNPTAYTSEHPEELGTVILEDSEGELRAQQSNVNALMRAQQQAGL